MTRGLRIAGSLLLTAAILLTGFFSMDLIEIMLPSYKDTVQPVDADIGSNPLLYIDPEEELTFYPWTTYQPKQGISVMEYSQNVDEAENDFQTHKKNFNARVINCLILLNSAYAPLDEPDFYSAMTWQQEESAFYLHHFSYEAEAGTYLLDLVWNGIHFLSFHVLPATSNIVSNDEIAVETSRLRSIFQNRNQYFAYPFDPVIPKEAEIDSITHWEDKKGDDFFGTILEMFYHATEDPTDDYLFGDQVPSSLFSLLFEGDYDMVFYGGNILIILSGTKHLPGYFLTPRGWMTGLLLYYDPVQQSPSGFGLLAE